MPEPAEIDERLARIGRQPFRAKFRLRANERASVQLRGLATMRRHAAEIIGQRLAPANPAKDGRQTPYRGHPVFVAQHATATCCRTCLQRWHGIAKGSALDAEQRRYVVEVIIRWIETQVETDTEAAGG